MLGASNADFAAAIEAVMWCTSKVGRAIGVAQANADQVGLVATDGGRTIETSGPHFSDAWRRTRLLLDGGLHVTAEETKEDVA